jgi:hypothetical protein
MLSRLRSEGILKRYRRYLMSNAEIISVIRTDLTKCGAGIDSDPIRIVTQYWDLDGKLLWEVDPWKEIEYEETKSMK